MENGVNDSLSNPELLLLKERCHEAGSRCEKRAQKAFERGDYVAAEREKRLAEQYRDLLYKIVDRRDHPTRPAELPADSEMDRLRKRGRAG